MRSKVDVELLEDIMGPFDFHGVQVGVLELHILFFCFFIFGEGVHEIFYTEGLADPGNS